MGSYRDEDWIFGVVLPFPGVEVSGLEPGVEYEIQTTVLSPDFRRGLAFPGGGGISRASKKPVQQPVTQRVKAEHR